jgi:hypothetical protein
MGPTVRDVLCSIGVFVGPPTLIFTGLVLRELRRLSREARAWRAEEQMVREEGLAPGPPVDPADP